MWGDLAQEQAILQALLDAAGLSAEVERAADHGEAHWFYLRTTLDPAAFEVLRPAVARAFDGATLRWRPHAPWLVLEIVRATPQRPFALADVWSHVAALPRFTALLGVTPENAPVHLTLDYPDNASLLVSGGAQSGKSNLLRLLALSAALSTPPRELRMALLHGPRGDALHALRTLPHVWHVAARPALPALVERLRARTGGGQPALVLVVIDDVEDILVRSGVRGENALHWLLSEGAAHHVMTVMAARAPAHLPAHLRELPRVHLTAAPVGAQIVKAGEAVPPRVQGAQFVLRHTALGDETMVRVPWCGARACAHVVTWYKAHRPIVEPLPEGRAAPAKEVAEEVASPFDETEIPELTLDDE